MQKNGDVEKMKAMRGDVLCGFACLLKNTNQKQNNTIKYISYHKN